MGERRGGLIHFTTMKLNPFKEQSGVIMVLQSTFSLKTHTLLWHLNTQKYVPQKSNNFLTCYCMLYALPAKKTTKWTDHEQQSVLLLTISESSEGISCTLSCKVIPLLIAPVCFQSFRSAGIIWTSNRKFLYPPKLI